MDSKYRIKEEVYRNGTNRFLIQVYSADGPFSRWSDSSVYGVFDSFVKAKEVLDEIRATEVVKVNIYPCEHS
jgi:hypothetical protein